MSGAEPCRVKGITVTLLLLLAMPALGQPGHSYVVTAEVVSADAIYGEVEVESPERVCKPVHSRSRGRSHSSSWSRGYDYRSDDYRPRRNHTGARIIGGLIGGALGNQFGGGSGKKALTIAGALIGSAVAGGRAEQRHAESRYRQRDLYQDDDDYDYRRGRQREFEPEYYCQTTTRTRTVEQVIGYDVTYRYNDRLYHRRMDHDPGATIDVRVSAQPDVAASRANRSAYRPEPSRRTL